MRKYLLALVLCAFSQSLLADTVPETILKTVSAINYRGVGFSTSQKEMASKLPKAKPNHAHPGTKEGLITFEVWDDKIIDCVLLRFANEQLVEIQYVYFPVTLARMGGGKAINPLAIKEYGNPTQKDGRKLTWDFPSIDRTIVISESKGQWSQYVFHRSRIDGLADYKETTAVPRKRRMYISSAIQHPVRNKKPKQLGDVTIPSKVVEGIQRKAWNDHPTEPTVVAYVITEQEQAYCDLRTSVCPKDMKGYKYKQLRIKINREHPWDFSTQLYVLNEQVAAHSEMVNMKSPEGVAGSHFFKLRSSAIKKHPNNYSTQLYVLKNHIKEYLSYRRARNSGDLIVRYLLRFD